MVHYTAIVIGSGPAGSACAKALKNKGVDCLVLDKCHLPRPKACSGLIYGQTQELLKKYFDQEVPEVVRCNPEIINAENVYEWKEDNNLVPYIWELPKDGKKFAKDWINVWRDTFDFWLLQESAAEYMAGVRFVKFKRTDDVITVYCKTMDDTPVQFSCNYLIGADGSASTVRKLIDPDGVTNAMTCVTNYSYFGIKDPGTLEDAAWYVFLRKEFGDIIACIHRKDDTFALSVGGFIGTKFDQCTARVIEFLEKQAGVKFGPRKKQVGCSAKLLPPDFGEDRVLLAGDAAGLIYLNGEGISVAVDSGYRAGLAIAEAEAGQNSDAASIYESNAQDILRHMNLCNRNMNFVVPQ